MALLIGPMVAILGVFTAFIVIRGRARNRKSVYSTLRSDRELRVRAARERALAVAAPGPASSQAVAEPPAPAVPSRPAWDVSPTSPAPTPPAQPAPVAPAFEPATQQNPAPVPAAPVPAAPAPRPNQAAADSEGELRGNLTQQVLSYAGLVAALVVVLLGVVLMIASSH